MSAAPEQRSTTTPGSGTGPPWTPPEPAELGALLPGYEILSLLGRGGMGAVYYAVQKVLDRPVAIKLLPAEVSVQPGFADRFTREARAMAKLNHPNIVSVYDFGTTAEGHLFFTMEFVEGTTLAGLIHGPGLNEEQALALSGQICLALAYAHGKGVVHRDMKPSNVIVDTAGNAKVADFGLARLVDPSDVEMGHTVTGMVMGTPDYMAPEQKRGMNVDHRADIYSLGVMLYEMLCRQTPQGVFTPPSQIARCDAGVDRIVAKAMQQQPERRYQTTHEMKADVDGVRSRGPRMKRRRTVIWLSGGAVAAAAAISVQAWHALSPEGKPPPPRAPASAAASVDGVPPEEFSDRAAAEWILRSGGAVHVLQDGKQQSFDNAGSFPPGSCQLIHFGIDRYKDRFPMPPLEGYRSLAGLRHLKSVFLNDLSVSDDSLAFLASNKGLTSLALFNVQGITAVTLDRIASLPALESLEITDCEGVRISGLSRFASRGVLRKLLLGNQRIGADELAALTAFPGLASLGLINCGISDEVLPALAPASALHRLDLGDCREFTGATLDRLAGIASLRILRLVSSGLNDDGCTRLAKLTQLSELELQATRITDTGLARLAALTNLRELHLGSVNVSPAAVEVFEAAVPGCAVLR